MTELGGEPMRIAVTVELDQRAGDALRAVAPNAEVVLLDRDGGLGRKNQVSSTPSSFPKTSTTCPKRAGAFINLLETSPPKWMQTASTGVEHALFAYLLESGAIVTNSPGVHGSTIAEYVFAYILSHAKRLTPTRSQPGGSAMASARFCRTELARRSESSATGASAKRAHG